MSDPERSGAEAAPAAPAPAAVRVRPDGTFAEANGGAGVRIAGRHDALAAYLRAFAATGAALLRCTFVADDGTWIAVAAEAADDGGAEARLTPWAAAPAGLTPRELDVLTLVAGGLSNPQIAVHLGCAERTVTTHVHRLLAKLEVQTRAGAGALAVERGLLRIPLPAPANSLALLTVGAVARVVEGAPPRPSRPQRPLRRRPFLVGSALPTVGPLRAEGEDMLRGSKLAIDEVNRRGGLAGRPVEQVVVPVDPCDRVSVERGLQELIDAEVDAIGTGYFLDDDRSTYRGVGEYGAPLLTAMTSERLAGWVGQEPEELGHVFQVGPTERHYGRGFVTFLTELRRSGRWRPTNRRLLFVETAATGGRTLAPDVVEAAERAGWQIDAALTVPAGAVDWTETADTIRRTEPAAVLVAHFLPEQLAAFGRAVLGDSPVPSLLYAVYTPAVADFVARAGTAAEGLLWASVTARSHDPVAGRFTAGYRRAYGAAPGRVMAGLAYDQIELLLGAWGRVGDPRAFGAVARALRDGHHRGVNGSYFFGHERQCGLSVPHETADASLGQLHTVYQVQDGQQRRLAPAGSADGTFRLPPWCAGAVAAARV